MEDGVILNKQKNQLIRNNLMCQYCVLFLFLLATYFLPSNRPVVVISLIVLVISGFILFYFRGKTLSNHFIVERYLLFLIQLFIFRKLGTFQGFAHKEIFGWTLNQMLLYWLPIFQINCMIGYNYGIEHKNKIGFKRNGSIFKNGNNT